MKIKSMFVGIAGGLLIIGNSIASAEIPSEILLKGFPSVGILLNGALNNGQMILKNAEGRIVRNKTTMSARLTMSANIKHTTISSSGETREDELQLTSISSDNLGIVESAAGVRWRGDVTINGVRIIRTGNSFSSAGISLTGFIDVANYPDELTDLKFSLPYSQGSPLPIMYYLCDLKVGLPRGLPPTR